MLIPIEQQLKDFLRSKHELIAEVQQGNAEHALAYVQSGEGLRMSDRFRQELRTIEDQLEHQRESFNEQGIALSKANIHRPLDRPWPESWFLAGQALACWPVH